MDEKDHKILSILQSDARSSYAAIARQLGLASSAVLERIRKLERAGTIRGYTTRIDPEVLGLGLLAFVFVQADERLSEPSTADRLAALPEVLEVHHVAGEDCYLAKVRCASPAHLAQVLREKFGAIENVRRTRSTIVLSTCKETGDLPIPSGGAE
jgi:Lrp/AsnC family transcriptional regulator, leucine-responsive regulatory protein